jgi:hypothetical protein
VRSVPGRRGKNIQSPSSNRTRLLDRPRRQSLTQQPPLVSVLLFLQLRVSNILLNSIVTLFPRSFGSFQHTISQLSCTSICSHNFYAKTYHADHNSIVGRSCRGCKFSLRRCHTASASWQQLAGNYSPGQWYASQHQMLSFQPD